MMFRISKKWISIILSICLIMTFLLTGCSSKGEEKADLVVYGTIYTAEEEGSELAEAFAVKNGKYVYVGDRKGVEKFIQKGKTEVVDRTGEGLIIPGCTEGHSHYFGVYGISNMLPGYKCSYEEVKTIIQNEFKEKGTDMKQFVSFGINPGELMALMFTDINFADELESIAPGIPIVLLDDSCHAAACSVTALKMAGLLDNPSIRGGAVELDSEGRPNGYIKDQAVGYVMDKAIDNPLTDEKLKEACKMAVDRLHEMGYTSAMDAWINLFPVSSISKILKEMDASGELTVNLSSCYNIKSYDAENYKAKVDYVASLNSDYQSSHYHPGYIKLFADGVTESGTGWLIDGYNETEDGEKKYGNIIWEQDELNSLVQYANSKGILVHTHSFGDGACKSLIDAYIASNEANNGTFRNCLGHVRNIRQEDVIRAANNKIPIAENMLWHTDYDENDPEKMIEKEYILGIVPEGIYYNGYPMKSLISNGVNMSSSTDAPVAETLEGNIMNVMEAATTGQAPGSGEKSFVESELLTVKEALQALTINGAWQLGLEDERGSIKTGKYADFVVLDKNILDYTAEQLRTIHDTKIVDTYFEGNKVYSAQ